MFFLNFPTRTKSILWFLLHCFSMSLIIVFARFVSDDLNPYFIVFLRNVFAVFLFLPLIVKKGIKRLIKTDQIGLHFVHGVIQFLSMYLWFYSVTLTTLPEITALGFMLPIFVTLGAIIFLKEKVNFVLWLTLIMGFTGMFVIVRPGFIHFNHVYIVMTAVVILWAAISIISKFLVYKDSPATITFYFNIFVLIISFIFVFVNNKFQDVNSWQLFICFCLGLFSNIAFIALNKAQSLSDISIFQPLHFTRLIFVSIIAYFLFGEVVDIMAIIGVVIILCSSQMLIMFKKNEEEILVSKEKTELLMKKREQFFNMVVHDLKNPIGGVQTCMEMIESENTNQGKGELIKEVNPLINQSLTDMNELVYKIMDASKIESGQEIKVNKKDFNIQKLYQEIINAFKLKAEHKNIELKIQIDKSIRNNTINSDPNLIKRIITNLVSNALKFTDKGTITLSAKIEEWILKQVQGDIVDIQDNSLSRCHPELVSGSIKNKKQQLILSVKDTGQGIAKQDIPKILEEYGQTIEGSKESTGTGLGLNIVKKFTEVLGGKLKIESKIGNGSEFSIILKS